MIEDKLDHDERLRLECLAQAIAATDEVTQATYIVSTAKVFEEYVRGDEAWKVMK